MKISKILLLSLGLAAFGPAFADDAAHDGTATTETPEPGLTPGEEYKKALLDAESARDKELLRIREERKSRRLDFDAARHQSELDREKAIKDAKATAGVAAALTAYEDAEKKVHELALHPNKNKDELKAAREARNEAHKKLHDARVAFNTAREGINRDFKASRKAKREEYDKTFKASVDEAQKVRADFREKAKAARKDLHDDRKAVREAKKNGA